MYIRLIKDVTEQGGDMTPAGTILSLRRSEGEPFEEDFDEGDVESHEQLLQGYTNADLIYAVLHIHRWKL